MHQAKISRPQDQKTCGWGLTEGFNGKLSHQIKQSVLVLFKSDEVGPRQTSYLLVVFLPPMHQIQRNAMKQSPSERFSRTIMYHDLLWKLEINMTFNNREKD